MPMIALETGNGISSRTILRPRKEAKGRRSIDVMWLTDSYALVVSRAWSSGKIDTAPYRGELDPQNMYHGGFPAPEAV